MIRLSRVARNQQWGAALGVWGGAPSARNFLLFLFCRNNLILGLFLIEINALEM